jgi:hypothetical protein
VPKRGLIIGLLLAALVAGIGATWTLSPTLRERVFLLGLASGVPVVQAGAARALEDYPTRSTALALVAFVHWAHQPPIDLRPASHTLATPDRATAEDRAWTLALLERSGCLPQGSELALGEIPQGERRRLYECLEEKSDAWEQARRPRLELAGSGFRSLCALTGQTFETQCRHYGSSASWGSLSDAQWSRALGSLNGWALQTLGGELLATAAGSPQG